MGNRMLDDAAREFAARLDEAMTCKGLSNDDVAGAVGVTPRTIRRWRKGDARQGVRASHLCRFRDGVGISPSFLLGFTDVIESKQKAVTS